MNKKNIGKYVLLILIFSVIVILFTIIVMSKTSALKDTLSIDCEQSNEILSCSLKGNSSYEISALSATINVDENGSIGEVITDPIWQGEGENGKIDFYTDVNKINDFDVATFTISLDDDIDEVKIDINDIRYYDKEFEEHVMEDVSKVIKVK